MRLLIIVTLAAAPRPLHAAPADTLRLRGLSQAVEIIKDRWGVSHIYASTEADLFFAQGFNVARDRLFQLEIWRRNATGTMAEMVGRRALQKDIGIRLLKFRGDLKGELNHYHPRGADIIGAFVQGINAYIDQTEREPALLPLEFKLLGIKPGKWTPEVVVSRHNGLFRNATQEIGFAKAVAALGAQQVQALSGFHPARPDLTISSPVDPAALSDSIMALYDASRAPVEFAAADLAFGAGDSTPALSRLAAAMPDAIDRTAYQADIGSNNWVVAGWRTLSGRPFMANDPHRAQQIPSLRYWVHLVGPGWNVIGAGEPALPGVSIGHNEHGAWGLTIFGVDQEDLYVYDTDPSDPSRYRYRTGWESVRAVTESIAVKGEQPVQVKLEFTRHGPLLYRDRARNKAYALRAAWLETGSAPYLASLRVDQARTWAEFRAACSYSRTPSENMIWADTSGTIGWQAVGITPVRKNFSGVIPVPGDGRFEWDRFLTIDSLPHVVNPPEGFFATANEYNVPDGFPIAVGYSSWADPFRVSRVKEFLRQGRQVSVMDMIRLQQDELSLPARNLVPLLSGLRAPNPLVQLSIETLLGWDHVLDRNSVGAAIYTAWERQLVANVRDAMVPEAVRAVLPTPPLDRMISWLTAPDGRFGPDPAAGRDAMLLKSLEQAVSELVRRAGPTPDYWRYGQEKLKHITIEHPLSPAASADVRAKLNAGPFPRGGSGSTVNNTGPGYNQTAGPSFRIIADLSDWDNSVGTNNPGQSGDPDSPHYRDLFVPWATGKYFTAAYSRAKVEAVMESATSLVPVQ